MPKGGRGYNKTGFTGRGKTRGRGKMKTRKVTHGSTVSAFARAASVSGGKGKLVRSVARKSR